MKVLLVNPPIRENAPPQHVPIGLAIVAKVLLLAGHDVRVLDINGERLSKQQVLERFDLNDEYDVVGAGGLITTYKYLTWLIPEIRKRNPRSTIVLGGGVVTSSPRMLLGRTPADIAVVREGEETIVELLAALRDNKPLKEIRGIAFKNQDGTIEVTQPRPLVEDLDALPFPAYELFPMKTYLANVCHADSINKRTEVDLIAARGCPYSCRYCYHIFGRGVRYRSPENVIAELQYLIERYSPESFLLLDELFITTKKRVKAFCDLLREARIDIPWSCYARVNVVDDEMLRTMKSAGCYRVGYGIESGSQRILDNMGKRVKIEQAERAIRLTRRAGLQCGMTFMFGYPGENLETIRETVDFCKRNLVQATFFYTTPYPGTELYNECEDVVLDVFGSEEKFVEVLGDAAQFTVNLTEFPDEELIRLKTEAEAELRSRSLWRSPLMLLRYYQHFGPARTTGRIISRLIPRRHSPSLVRR